MLRGKAKVPITKMWTGNSERKFSSLLMCLLLCLISILLSSFLEVYQERQGQAVPSVDLHENDPYGSGLCPSMPWSLALCDAGNAHTQSTYIESIQPLSVPLNVLTTIAEYYIANKPYDSDWRVLSVTNIEAYLGSFALGKQYITKIPAEVYAEERDELRCFGM